MGVTARVVNTTAQAAPMVILDLPLPPGFALDADGLRTLVADGTIAKYQLTPRSAIVYLRQLAPGKPLALRYRLRATMPVVITAPAARAYEYYNPDRQKSGGVTHLTVKAAHGRPVEKGWIFRFRVPLLACAAVYARSPEKTLLDKPAGVITEEICQ